MRVSRGIQTAVALAVTAGLLFVGTNASAEDGEIGSSVTATQHIQVTTTPKAFEGPCQTRNQALSYTTADNAAFFSLTIEVAGKLCNPITDVKAVIYRMPGKGVAWPQTLVEQLDFTIEDAATIEVRFTKTCSPVQFDVITGGTPDQIGFPPLGFHGPLLFPTQGDTALQFWGLPASQCGGTPSQFSFGSAGPVCVNDFPYIQWAVPTSGMDPVPTSMKITVRDINDNVVKVVENAPLSGQVIWPGASEDPPDWPGWKLVNGHWEEVDDDAILREGLKLTGEVNGQTATRTINYPESTAACASPLQATTTTTTTTSTPPDDPSNPTSTTIVGDPSLTGGSTSDPSSSSGVPLSVAG